MESADPIKTQLRLPAQLQARLVVAAKESGRSMNAEIVHRLAESFDNEDVGEFAIMATAAHEKFRQNEDHWRRIGKLVMDALMKEAMNEDGSQANAEETIARARAKRAKSEK